MTYSSTSGPIMWRVAAAGPACGQPLILRHDVEYRPFLCCARYPSCLFVSGHNELINALLDRIITLQDGLEAFVGHPVETALP
jgi:ssDNA-binding Zn-finger/Zn-ribbon topoisomerase 1